MGDFNLMYKQEIIFYNLMYKTRDQAGFYNLMYTQEIKFYI